MSMGVKEEEPSKGVSDYMIKVTRTMRDRPPAHYSLIIESFSLLSLKLLKNNLEHHESGPFETGGYKWRLSLYPKGDGERNGNGHISLYLVMLDTDALPSGWEVNVIFKLFIFNQIQDKYLTVQAVNGKLTRFNASETKIGFPQLLSLATFSDASNGYLVDDFCMFGVEVTVIKCAGKGESWSIIEKPDNSTHTWKIDKFSSLRDQTRRSPEFVVGGSKWSIQLHPKGNLKRDKSTYLSLYLNLPRTLGSNGQKSYVEFVLRIKDQLNGNHHEMKAEEWYSTSDEYWGFSRFLSLADLKKESKGFIVNDTLIIEAEITAMSVVKYFS